MKTVAEALRAVKYYGRVIARAWRDTSLVDSPKLISTVLVIFVGHLLQWDYGLRRWPDAVKYAVLALITYALVSAFGFLWNLILAPVRIHGERELEIDRVRCDLADASKPDSEERQRRQRIIDALRAKYLTDGRISVGEIDDIRLGVMPLPRDWVDQQLARMGETWRQERYL